MTATTYTCPYCRLESAGAGESCPSCGAPVNVRLRTTSGGWTELPAMKDMTRIQAGQSSVQVEGSINAVADWDLAAGEGVYFPHHVMLWLDPAVTLTSMPMARAWTRLRAGLPLFMLQASGPGHIAFAHHTSGELVALPLQAGSAVDVIRAPAAPRNAGRELRLVRVGRLVLHVRARRRRPGRGLGTARLGLEMMGDEREERPTRPVGTTRWVSTGSVRGNRSARAGDDSARTGTPTCARWPRVNRCWSSLRRCYSRIRRSHSTARRVPRAGIKLWRTWGNRYLWLRVWGPGRIGIESAYVPPTTRAQTSAASLRPANTTGS